MNNETVFSKDLANKKLLVTRRFNAPVNKVWKAWTESSILDKWWAPRPWRAKTKTMDFSEGGHWLYTMVSPEGEKHWCCVEFKTVNPEHSFTALNGFSDEDGNFTAGASPMNWLVEFKGSPTSTTVEVTITFDSEADLEKIIDMGFQQGFTMGLSNLDEVLAAS